MNNEKRFSIVSSTINKGPNYEPRKGIDIIPYYSGGLFAKFLVWIKLRPPWRPCIKINITEKKIVIIKRWLYRDNSIIWPLKDIEIIKLTNEGIKITNIMSKHSENLKRIIRRDNLFDNINDIKSNA